MPTNKQKVYDVVSAHLSGQEFSCQDLFHWIDVDYPGTPHDSIIPSDYLYQDAVKSDPSNDGNRHQDVTYPRFLERLGRNRYRFGGWDGVPSGAIVAPVTRSLAQV
jgi:hypothetical protein